jgi:predicted Co/Zn/Cd cation transporter (cation efflux family)
VVKNLNLIKRKNPLVLQTILSILIKNPMKTTKMITEDHLLMAGKNLKKDIDQKISPLKKIKRDNNLKGFNK